MTLLFLDTETSGLPRKDRPADAPEQPWVCFLAADLSDQHGNTLALLSTAIRANGRHIGAGATRIHGVTTAQAGRTGISELAALAVLCGRESLASQAQYLVGHGISFDRDVIVSVLAKNGREAATLCRPGLTMIDTMTAAAPFCQLPTDHDSNSYRWPKLKEACAILLGETVQEGPHDAFEDLRSTKRLFFWLRSHNAFEMEAA
jgi:hypothetical protein